MALQAAGACATRRKRQLPGFPCGDESLMEGADLRIVACRYERGHVQHRADSGAATPDRGFAPQRATVAARGRHADELGDGLAIELAEVRQLTEQRGRGD